MLGHVDLTQWVSTLGYVGIFLIVFAECGLFVFFMPGDSLLFTAGFLASQHLFHLNILLPNVLLAALAAYFVAYQIGKKVGYYLMQRPDGRLFKKKYLEESKIFYEKHGRKALILGRLLPIIRTFVPVVAGMVEMPMKRFVALNVIGTIVWAGGITLLGYCLGQSVPQAQHYILPIVMMIIVVSLIPGLWHLMKR